MFFFDEKIVAALLYWMEDGSVDLAGFFQRSDMSKSVFAAGLVCFLGLSLLLFPFPAMARCPGVSFAPRTAPVSFGDDLDPAGLEQAARASLAWLERSGLRQLPFADRNLSTGQLRAGLELLLRLKGQYPGRAAFLAAVKKDFIFYRPVIAGAAAGLLVTGYYQPSYSAARERSACYRYPIYGLPRDLVVSADGSVGRRLGGEIVPYPTRAEIEAHGLPTAPVLAWMRDPLEAFIVHVQGSAVLRMRDGGEMDIGFAGRNGRPYRSIGAWLVKKGFMPLAAVSMPAIISFFRRHPAMIRKVLDYNESYIFFRRSGRGPRGSLGEPLVPGRSVALDRRCFPEAAPLFLSSRRPLVDDNGAMIGSIPMRRIVFHHDSGSAIRGPSRLDLFMGRGGEAAAMAGVMRQPGEIFVLLPRNIRIGEEIVAAPTAY